MRTILGLVPVWPEPAIVMKSRGWDGTGRSKAASTSFREISRSSDAARGRPTQFLRRWSRSPDRYVSCRPPSFSGCRSSSPSECSLVGLSSTLRLHSAQAHGRGQTRRESERIFDTKPGRDVSGMRKCMAVRRPGRRMIPPGRRARGSVSLAVSSKNPLRGTVVRL